MPAQIVGLVFDWLIAISLTFPIPPATGKLPSSCMLSNLKWERARNSYCHPDPNSYKYGFFRYDRARQGVTTAGAHDPAISTTTTNTTVTLTASVSPVVPKVWWMLIIEYQLWMDLSRVQQYRGYLGPILHLRRQRRGSFV